jgi:hypothetical protein
LSSAADANWNQRTRSEYQFDLRTARSSPLSCSSRYSRSKPKRAKSRALVRFVTESTSLPVVSLRADAARPGRDERGELRVSAVEQPDRDREDDGDGPEVKQDRPQGLGDAHRRLADAVGERAREVVAEITMGVVLEVCVQIAGHVLALPRPDEDLAEAGDAAEQELARDERDEQRERVAQPSAQRGPAGARRLRHPLDDLPDGVRDHDPARGVGRLEHEHRQIPGAVTADEVKDEPEGRVREHRSLALLRPC